MINLEKAKEVFMEYVKEYDEKNPKIARKITHTLRTADVALKIANELELNEADVLLAGLIGLLHDIGRFEQLRIYDTYNDLISIDHAKQSNIVLFEQGYIRKFVDEDKYDEIIKKAIANHNKASIEEGLDEKTLLHAKIIRDADKTDIFVAFISEEKGKGLYDYDVIGNYKLTDSVFSEFKQCKQIDRSILKNDLDWFISNLSFTFDYNFKPGLKIIKEKSYIESMLNKITNKSEENNLRLKEIQEVILNYIDKRLEK